MNNQPNFLLITTDQQRWDHLGLAGVKGIETPNLDRLGHEGVHFNRAYTCSPLCTPARVSLLTGLYPSIHGAYSIGVTIHPFPQRTIPGMLAEAGYATALFGKAHFVCRKDEQAQIAGTPNPPPDFFSLIPSPSLASQKPRSVQAIRPIRSPICITGPGLSAMTLTTLNGSQTSMACTITIIVARGTFQLGSMIQLGSQNARWITCGGKRAPRGEAHGFAGPAFRTHMNRSSAPSPGVRMCPMDDVEPFEGYREGEFDDKPFFYKSEYEQHDWGAFADDYGVPCSFNRMRLTEQAQEALQSTLGMIALIDDRVGAILRTLNETGQAENTIVIFTTDHGEHHGKHGLWHKGLHAYEDCQRVPLLAWGPGLNPKTGTTQALVNLIDIPHTILSLAGVDIPCGLQGLDMTPLLRSEVETIRDQTIIECHATHLAYQQTMVTDRYKLVVYRDLELGELYDLRADPDQYANLWHVKDYSGLKAELLLRFAQENMRREGHVLPRAAFA